MNLLRQLVEQPAPWIQSPGDHHGIVVSSRVRLARNLDGYHFRRRLPSAQREALVQELLPRLGNSLQWPLITRMDELNQSERLALVERHLASLELISNGSQAGIVVRGDGLASIMVNEEDHLRIQVLGADLSVEACLATAIDLDQQLAVEQPWAYHADYGYLTSCPTNLGTGLRASVMLHLPGLAQSKELPRMLRGLNRLHMTARGMNGEGTQACGHFYQVSNQRTLGYSEEDILELLLLAVGDIIDYEIMSRETLLAQRRSQVEDRVWRAWGMLRHARRLGSDETIDQLSWLRLGRATGIIDATAWATLDHLLVSTQRAHLQLRDPAALDAETRDQLRAHLVREALN